MESLPQQLLIRVLSNWLDMGAMGTLEVTQVSGGLSNASLWKVTTPQECFCLRRTPVEHAPQPWRHRKTHEFIAHICQAGLRIVPLPKQTRAGESNVQIQGNVWELSSWLTGNATRTPTLEQAKAAADALARFHLAAASFHQLHGCPAGLQDRLVFLGELHRGLRVLKSAVDRSPPLETRDIARNIIGPMEAALPKAIDAVQRSRKKVPIQWCLRDPHIGNFLFVGSDVTGIVDFATAGLSSVAQDIARLIGSMVPQLSNPWQESLEAYRQIRPLSSDEVRLIFAFHISGTIGAAANWLRWRFLENLSRADAATTQARLGDLALRLELLAEAESGISAVGRPIA